jgi:hypothetical protein
MRIPEHMPGLTTVVRCPVPEGIYPHAASANEAAVTHGGLPMMRARRRRLMFDGEKLMSLQRPRPLTRDMRCLAPMDRTCGSFADEVDVTPWVAVSLGGACRRTPTRSCPSTAVAPRKELLT